MSRCMVPLKEPQRRRAMEEATVQDRLRELMERLQSLYDAHIDEARKSEQQNLRACLDELRRIAGEIREIVNGLHG